MKKIFVIFLCVVMSALTFSNCGLSDAKADEEKVVLTIAGPWEECEALENAADKFTEENPNCEIQYEFVQDFEQNLPTRLEGDEDKVDLFLGNNVQKASPYFPYALELSERDDLDLSDTFDGLLKNFKLQTADKKEKNKFYSIPMVGELRGMYVNTTLLDKLDIKVPTNRSEFLSACKKIQEAGYIPVNGNPSLMGQQFLYPYVCNLIANSDDYEGTYNKVNNREEGVSNIFQEPMKFMYDVMSKGYYKYKYVETELNLFTDNSNEGYAKSFLNIVDIGNGEEKQDDVGQSAFMPSTISLSTTIDKIKEDYHSKIDYEFILSPVAEDGGYAYLSPGTGISINKNSDNIDLAIKFLNFISEKDNNIALAEDMNGLPTTKNVISIISDRFDIPEEQICQLGQVTFDYDFYSVISETLLDISKGNNPKYMKDAGNGKTELYSFSYYMNILGERFKEAK